MPFRRDEDLPLSQHQINDPATPDVRPLAPAMVQNVSVRTTSFFKGISEERKAGEGFFLIDGLGQGDDRGSQPVGGDRDGVEGDTEDAAK